MSTKLLLGVDLSGGECHLAAVGRRFRRLVLLDELHLPQPLDENAASEVAAFLDRHRLHEARVIACLPREAVLVRFLNLPAEAEPQLAKVVGYQLGALHPYKDDQVHWDCAVVDRDPKTKQISVMVVLAEKSRVNRSKQALQELGLRLSGLTLGAAALAALLKPLLPPTALIVCGRNSGVELLSFHQGNLCATQEIPLEPSASVAERFEREWHRALAALPVSDPAALPRFVCGSVPPAFSAFLEGASPLPGPKLSLSKPRGPVDFEWPALAAAYAGLIRRAACSINLLPPEERWEPRTTARLPVYVLSATAALLALILASHAWIERALYNRALERALRSVQPQAQQLRQQNQETSTLEARAALLENLRATNWHKLDMLQQLTKLLPDGTWLQELRIGEDMVEMNGFSNHAAELVPPLENSPFFTQVEFTAPITRDNLNREVFRIRMRLKPAGH
ncbi:MAG TPA: PilN domain-containing protein [archaeon]|nr:PilN domain-containing protein [archaeon]